MLPDMLLASLNTLLHNSKISSYNVLIGLIDNILW